MRDARELADRTLVWSYRDINGDTLESCYSYNSDQFGDLHFAASQFIGDQLDQFYAEFSEWFNLADFPDVVEQMEASEVPVFIRVAGFVEDDDSSTEYCDSFSGLRAVIRRRVDQFSFEQIKMAAALFNWTIDFGLDLCDAQASAEIRIGSVEEVAPLLLKRILNRLPDDRMLGNAADHTSPTCVVQRFLPLVPVLTMLKETIESPGWVQNQLALQLFFWIAEMYRVELENEAG
jgi:hypothetical protein